MPLPDVRPSGYARPPSSDVYGRIWFVLKWDDMAQVTLSKPGFRSEVIDLHCSKTLQRLERAVTLERNHDDLTSKP